MLLIGDILRRTADRHPDKVGLVFGDFRITWDGVNEQANSLANGLLGLGLQTGDTVGILMRNCPEYIVSYFALAKAGFLDIPLNWRLSEREIAELLAFWEVDALIAGEPFLSLLERIKGDIPSLRKCICLGNTVPPRMIAYESLVSAGQATEPQVSLDEQDPYIMLSTGGTTGRAKGVLHAHRQHFLSSLVMLAAFKMDEHTVSLQWPPFFHVGGLVGGNLTLTRAAARQVIMDKFDPLAFLQTVEREGITQFFAAPTVLREVMLCPEFANYDVTSVRQIILVSAPTSPATSLSIIEHFPAAELYQSYGMTEILSLTTLCPTDQLRKSHTVGKLSLDIDLKIVDEVGHALGVGRVGEIVVRSDRLFKEYCKLPQETSEAKRDGWFHTGDMGYMDEEGFLTIADRKKDMIISGGENIYSREVEDVLYSHPGVAEAAVIGVPDDKWGESVHAIVALKPGFCVTEQEVIDFCRKNMASYKKPRTVEFASELPKLPTNKINKRELRDRHWQGRERRLV